MDKTRNLVSDLHNMVHRFNTEIIGLPIPDKPTMLTGPRAQWAVTALNEEISEFGYATTTEDQADALLDLCYFALGRLVEMGIAPGAAFEAVHAANMQKKRGELSKRPGSLGFDAVKPEGWKAPDLSPYLFLRKTDLIDLEKVDTEQQGRTKGNSADAEHQRIIVLGHARHGKDTVGELLSKKYGLTFTSGSEFCASQIIYPALREKYGYRSPRECFEDRANHRAEWYDLITGFNTPDARALGLAIFEENDIYCGPRNSTELHALINHFKYASELLVIWVDASKRLPLEDPSSISVQPWMADFVIDNNGTQEQLEFNIDILMEGLLT